MGRYERLYKWLRTSSGPRISLTFEQIEEILGFGLPDTARKDAAWWANEKTAQFRYNQRRAWLNAGFHTENLSLPNETVDFVLSL